MADARRNRRGRCYAALAMERYPLLDHRRRLLHRRAWRLRRLHSSADGAQAGRAASAVGARACDSSRPGGCGGRVSDVCAVGGGSEEEEGRRIGTDKRRWSSQWRDCTS